jgi:hypothetical protein
MDSGRRRLSGHGISVVVTAWGVSCVLGLVIVSIMRSGSNPPTAAVGHDSHMTSLAGTIALPRNDQLLMDGRETTLADARTTVNYQILVPDIPEANHANLAQVWVNGQRSVALVFDGGKVTVTMAPAQYKDPTSNFEAFINSTRVTAVMGQVHGQPALIISPRTDASRTNKAWVEFDHHGIDVNIFSSTYGTGTLLAIANSMR